jgi:hypothetical protein
MNKVDEKSWFKKALRFFGFWGVEFDPFKTRIAYFIRHFLAIDYAILVLLL